MRPLLIIFFAFFCSASGVAAEDARLVFLPERIELRGEDRQHGLIVTRIDADGRQTDVTALSTFTSSQPSVVVDAAGQCLAKTDGAAEIEIMHAGLKAKIPATAVETGRPRVPSFRQDIEPILTKAGCNAGGCHGKLAGQNGFRLSLRGFAPEWDHEWLTEEVSGRRINIAFPEQSLLVQKPAGGVMHEGGMKFREGSRFYQTLIDWIAARAPGPAANEADVARLEILPGDRALQPGDRQQLLVRAHYASGRVRDVTWLAQFFSNDETIVSVKPDGLVKAVRAGETSVRVHFQGQVEVVRLTIPFTTDVAGADFATTQNALDAPIFQKLAGLHLPPSPACDDLTFLRRASLDATGTLPTPEEVAAFAQDPSPDKRVRLVEALLKRPEFTDYWTLQLADLLQNRKERDHDVRGTKGVRAFHAWLRAQVAADRSWRDIAEAVLLAKGDVITSPAVGYYVTVIGEKQRVEESELPDSIAQSFLGTRIGCARCHNHPLEKYTQDDFYHFAAFFSKVALKRESPGSGATVLTTTPREEEEQRKRLAEAEVKAATAGEIAASIGEESGGEAAAKAEQESRKQVAEATKRLVEITGKPPGVNQPRTGKTLAPRSLNGTAWSGEAGSDPREPFTAWALGSEQFSGAMVNRLWRHFFGVGLVEPVDDLRASNPPSNAALWALLNREFVEHGYDLKHIMRLILNSRAYQLSSATVAGNETDAKFHSHYYARRLPAEVLLDAIAAATGVPTKFDGHPLGLRAIQLPEPGVSSYFLSLFGRSERVTACACERAGEVTLPQLLHLQNSDELQRQITAAGGRLTGLLGNADEPAVLDTIFRATVGRAPSSEESAAVAKALATDGREAVLKDLFWALLNSKEFAFNH